MPTQRKTARTATSATSATSAYRDRNSTSDRTLDILGMFSEARTTITANDVAARFGTARSTAYRYLQTLISAGYLEEDPRGGFRLGLRIFELARVARRAYQIEDIVGPVLDQLSASTGETALLTRRSDTSIVCLERSEPLGRQLRLSYERGSVLGLNAGASALVLIAWEDDATVVDLLSRAQLTSYTSHTLTDERALRARLSKARDQGYVVSRGELDKDAVGVAAPVWSGGRVIAGISIAAVGSRVTEKVLHNITAQVVAAAQQVTELLELSSQ